MLLPHHWGVDEDGVPRTVDASTLPHFRGSLGHFATSVPINSSTTIAMGMLLRLVCIARDCGDHDELR
ncbi:hypothetical protein CGQ24_12310 [Arthrobacter sp. 7749]|nr:hypothetical protein CGQ24_12310 [Arthrobacter sp. 7749]